jgi:ubiquinol-cytochrome c reductase iron-sulfur subunit
MSVERHGTSGELTTGGASTGLSTGSSATERFVDPGLPPHRARQADVDPRAAKRAERQIVVLFAISVIGTIGFILAYVLVRPGETVASMRLSNLLLGIALFFTMFGIGAAAVHWAKTLMSDHEREEARHPQRSDEAIRAEAVGMLKQGAEESGIGRRGVLKGAVLSAVALAPLTVAVPLIGELGGDWNINRFRHTLWGPGRRLAIDPTGEPIRAASVTIGSTVHVIPEGMREEAGSHWIEEKAKAVVLMVRIDPRELTEAEDRRDWSFDGIVAYSKICTHVGCPVALYEQQTHHLLCPCHQSTFDMSDGAKIVFGPASRPLPQLPITVDDEGYLIAQDDFDEPIGPSYWERLR